MLVLLAAVVSGAVAQTTYKVSVKEGTEDATSWTIAPPEATTTGVAAGTEVTATYNGTKKVKSVKAVKKAPATITVTWNNDDITGSGTSFTKDGVTITAGDIDFDGKNFNGGGTFTTTLGNFTKIEVTTYSWRASGTGWSGISLGQSGTWTGTPASSVSFSGDITGIGYGNTKFVFTIEPTNAAPDEEVAVTKSADNQWTLTMPEGNVELEIEYYATTPFDLTVGESLHGTVAFSVGGAAATQACYDDEVTVTVTPYEGYSAKDVTVRAYTSWESAARSFRAPSLMDEVEVTKQQDGTWKFTMPEANVWVVVSYTKDLQDSWIETIADVTYTGEAIEPTIVVKDGETTLVENTDYTVTYANNTAAGTAIVTVTAVEGSDYSGTATATFAIQKADITMTTTPTAVEGLVYSGEAQTLITAGVASFGTVLYSIDGENYNEALPTATDAGTYTVTYKVEGDDNHNAFAAQTVNVTIATNKTALNTAITDAETYYNTISESNPTAAAELLEAINAAKDVQTNADATQTEIETAAQTLNDAVTAAQTEVALKRIIITIPAKSYVARIDADKRQIENAVAGVSLYTVASVTNSEVVLTSALTVVDAEMPYLIYNDNDEEMTISIVVSTEEADAVEYDSEHFKGTLEAKTFTDADMQAADHYVLSNGKDFVWVKDAGTLAAGKCWIELVPSSESHARTLAIVFEDETTGISAVKTAATIEGNCYDLSGRKVAQPTKGLFIVNGKKVVIK